MWYLIVSIPDLCIPTYFNQLMPNEISHGYLLNESFSNFMVVGRYFSNLFKLIETYESKISGEPDPVLHCLTMSHKMDAMLI